MGPCLLLRKRFRRTPQLIAVFGHELLLVKYCIPQKIHFEMVSYAGDLLGSVLGVYSCGKEGKEAKSEVQLQ